VASLIINLDLLWNPAVLEHRIARVHRLGQKNNVQVINFVSADTSEELMLTKLNFKSSMFEGILDDGSESIFMEDSKFDKLMQTVQEFDATAPSSILSHEESSPEELVSQSIHLLSAFARTLSSPEATEKFVDALIETDKDTGKVSLKRPVPDRDSVIQVMSIIGKFYISR